MMIIRRVGLHSDEKISGEIQDVERRGLSGEIGIVAESEDPCS